MARWIFSIGIGLTLAGSGCSKLVGIEELHAHDANMTDVAIDTPVIPGCDAGVLVAPLAEDTMMLDDGNANPSIRYGASDTLNLGLSGTSRVLLRFTLTQAMVDALGSGGAVEATLSITLRSSGGGCGGACPNAATTFQVYALTDGWNEGNATPYVGASWSNRIGLASTMQTAWQTAGADGTSDRSQLALVTHQVTASEAAAAGPIAVTFPLDGQARSEMMARVAGSRLSLIVVPTAGGSLFLLSREAAATASQLSVSVCP